MGLGLDMFGTIDDTFQSVAATRTPITTLLVLGIPSVTEGNPIAHKVTLQPVSDKEIQFLGLGARRIGDLRKIYVNDGETQSIAPSDVWTLAGVDGKFRAIKIDNRPWRNYARIIISREDDS